MCAPRANDLDYHMLCEFGTSVSRKCLAGHWNLQEAPAENSERENNHNHNHSKKKTYTNKTTKSIRKTRNIPDHLKFWGSNL